MVGKYDYRLDKDNIIEYIQSFNKKQIRQTRHSNSKTKNRRMSFEDITRLLLIEKPVMMEQQEFKKFLLVYEYDEIYDGYIVISIKDKFIKI